MKPREMELFAAVARTGSVTLGASEAGMSQPAASTMLRQLETRLGFELFARQRRRLELTQNGRTLLPEVTHALAAMDSVEQLADTMGRKRPGRLIVGAIPAAGASIVPAAVKQFQGHHPGVTVVLRPGTAIEVIEMAASQRIDVGLVFGSGAHEHVGFKRLAGLHLVCVMPEDHPLARADVVSVEQLAGVDYVAHSRQLPIGTLTAAAFEGRGLKFQPTIEVGQFSAACAFAAAGCGVAIVDSLTAVYARRQGLAARQLAATGQSDLNLVWPIARGLNLLARRLSACLQEPLAMLRL